MLSTGSNRKTQKCIQNYFLQLRPPLGSQSAAPVQCCLHNLQLQWELACALTSLVPPQLPPKKMQWCRPCLNNFKYVSEKVGRNAAWMMCATQQSPRFQIMQFIYPILLWCKSVHLSSASLQPRNCGIVRMKWSASGLHFTRQFSSFTLYTIQCIAFDLQVCFTKFCLRKH